MKKYLFTFIVISFLLTGCYSKTEVQETTINNPYEISINNEILSYYGNKDDIPKSFDVLDISASNLQNDSRCGLCVSYCRYTDGIHETILLK